MVVVMMTVMVMMIQMTVPTMKLLTTMVAPKP